MVFDKRDLSVRTGGFAMQPQFAKPQFHQTRPRHDLNARSDLESVIDVVVANIQAAQAVEKPFAHIEFDRIFPESVYSEMISAMPKAADYRPLPGRNKGNLLADGTSTRVKIDLFPEYIRHLPDGKRKVWDMVGQALCSKEVRRAFVQRLAPGLKRRFGNSFAGVRMYPIPVLTRDVPGYRITPHTDTHWKGITVQIYLPRDASAPHLGTVFHERLPDGGLPKAKQMKFLPNSGYAFAVGDDTWHSADPVGHEVKSRDSILLTYFVDTGPLRILRNRGKRVGNFLLSEAKHLVAR